MHPCAMCGTTTTANDYLGTLLRVTDLGGRSGRGARTERRGKPRTARGGGVEVDLTEGRKEGRNGRTNKRRKEGRKKGGKKEGNKERRKEGKKERRREGKKEASQGLR